MQVLKRSPWSPLIHTDKHLNLGEYNIEHFQAPLGVFGLDERDVVPLQHDPAQLFLSVPLRVHLRGVVQHQIHVLVKSRDVALNPAYRTMLSKHCWLAHSTLCWHSHTARRRPWSCSGGTGRWGWWAGPSPSEPSGCYRSSSFQSSGPLWKGTRQ